MALKATICKAQIDIADIDRQHYAHRSLTVARHPSENDQRMMVRLLAFCLNDSDDLRFTRGLSETDEPELWQHSDDGQLLHWIELGEPDEKRLRQACGRSRDVSVYCYQSRSAEVWWRALEPKVQRLDNLAVFRIDDPGVADLAVLASRNMQLDCTIQEGVAWLGDGQRNVQTELLRMK